MNNGERYRVKYFTHRVAMYCLAICLIALSLCLAGCSANVESPAAERPIASSDTILPTLGSALQTSSSALQTPDTIAPTPEAADPTSDPTISSKDFEQDPYTTEFVIDRTLAQAIRENQGLPDDMPLTKEFAGTVTELSLFEGERVKTITGISNFTSLERLMISNTDCKDIEELARMPSLINIDISWGYITELPDFSGCPNLTELHLPANCITDLTPLCKAPSLRFVNLSDNDILSIAPLRDVTFLEYLCLEGNGITDYAAIKDSEALCQALDNGSQSPLEYALEVEERAKTIVREQIDDFMTPEAKLVKLYAYIIDTVSFDDSPHQNRPFGYRALFSGEGVCGDYAEALCLLARHAGLVCRVVSTDTHAFNTVELDGKWHLFDSLWDDTEEGVPADPADWSYFGFTTETALALPDHAYDTNRFPVCR